MAAHALTISNQVLEEIAKGPSDPTKYCESIEFALGHAPGLDLTWEYDAWDRAIKAARAKDIQELQAAFQAIHAKVQWQKHYRCQEHINAAAKGYIRYSDVSYFARFQAFYNGSADHATLAQQYESVLV